MKNKKEILRDGDFMIEKNDKIKAVYKSDLQKFLLSTGLLSDFSSGKLKCRYCGEVITENNLHAFIPCGDHFEVCCNNVNCTLLFVQDARKESAEGI